LDDNTTTQAKAQGKKDERKEDEEKSKIEYENSSESSDNEDDNISSIVKLLIRIVYFADCRKIKESSGSWEGWYDRHLIYAELNKRHLLKFAKRIQRCESIFTQFQTRIPSSVCHLIYSYSVPFPFLWLFGV
jgi:hypothetical protein